MPSNPFDALVPVKGNQEQDFSKLQPVAKQPSGVSSSWTPARPWYENLGLGAAKGLGQTELALHLPQALNAIPGVGQYLAPTSGIEHMKQWQHPEGVAQNVGYGLEKAGEYALPLGAESKAGEALSGLIPAAGTRLSALMRAGATAAPYLSTGAALGAIQGHSPVLSALGNAAPVMAVGALRTAFPGLAERAAQAALGPEARNIPVVSEGGHALSQEGLWGTRRSLINQLNTRLGEYSQKLNKALADSALGGESINLKDVTSNALTPMVKTSLKAGDRKAAKSIINWRRNFLKGHSTYEDPLTAYETKQTVGNSVRNFPATEKEANIGAAKRSVMRRINRAIGDSLPGAKALTERESGLMTARDMLLNQARVAKGGALLPLGHAYLGLGEEGSAVAPFAMLRSKFREPVILDTAINRLLGGAHPVEAPTYAPSIRPPLLGAGFPLGQPPDTSGIVSTEAPPNFMNYGAFEHKALPPARSVSVGGFQEGLPTTGGPGGAGFGSRERPLGRVELLPPAEPGTFRERFTTPRANEPGVSHANSPVSREGINAVKREKQGGISRRLVNLHSGKSTPIANTIDSRDLPAPPGHRIETIGPHGIMYHDEEPLSLRNMTKRKYYKES